MKTYYVTVRIEETIEVQAEDEDRAIRRACEVFDPLSHDTEVVECYEGDSDD